MARETSPTNFKLTESDHDNIAFLRARWESTSNTAVLRRALKIARHLEELNIIVEDSETRLLLKHANGELERVKFFIL